MSDVTIYARHKRFGGLEAADVRRLRDLEADNAKLKKLLAGRDLEIELMANKMVGAPCAANR